SQTALQGITPELSYLLAEMCSEKAAIWVGFLTAGQGDKDAAELAMLNSLFCVRIILRLFTTGYEHPYKDKTVEDFWTVSQTHFGEFLGYVSHGSAVPPAYRNIIGK